MLTNAKTAIAALALGVVSVATAAPASAVLWRSQSDPLFVYEDDVRQGGAYGNFYNDGQVRAMSTSWQKDYRPGGNYVRVETDFMFYGPTNTCGGNACWYTSASKQTVETRSDDWIKDSRARDLAPQGEKARGHIDICEVQAWSNDPCSAKALPTFDY
ncbi:exported hypothetical protein [metagenome]|uniref:Uncharacterized protein n=1 Tax=metagenome TaxID=256318 RepID=A0A2P2CII3_9ZZZZ